MTITSTIDRWIRIAGPEAQIATLTLNLGASGTLPEATRLFVRNHVAKALASRSRDSGARGVFEDLNRRIQDQLEAELRPEANALFLVAGPDLWEPLELHVPMSNDLFVGRSPFVAPLLAALDETPPALVGRGNEREAILEKVDLGAWEEVGRWTPVEVDRDPEHTLSGGTPVMRSSARRARQRVGGGKRERYQRGIEAEAAHLLAEMARRVAVLHAESPAPGVYFFGEADRFRIFRDHVPVPLRERAEYLGAIPPTREVLRRKVAERLSQRALERREAEAFEFHERRARGRLVALGPGDVLAHRTDGRLARVFLDPREPVPGARCLACSTLRAGEDVACGYCGGKTVPVSLTQEIIAHSWTHPPLPLTFPHPPARWLKELGGMAGLLSDKGMRGRG